MPKELLPIVDKPLIQYAVEEAVEAVALKGLRFDCGLLDGFAMAFNYMYKNGKN